MVNVLVRGFAGGGATCKEDVGRGEESKSEDCCFSRLAVPGRIGWFSRWKGCKVCLANGDLVGRSAVEGQ